MEDKLETSALSELSETIAATASDALIPFGTWLEDFRITLYNRGYSGDIPLDRWIDEIHRRGVSADDAAAEFLSMRNS